MTRRLQALAALLALAACDPFETVEGAVLAENLVVEAVTLRSDGDGDVMVRVDVRNAGEVDFSSASVALTVEGDRETRLVGGAVPGGLAAGERGTIRAAASGPPLGGVACYRYVVSVAATSADQTVGTSAEYAGTCDG